MSTSKGFNPKTMSDFVDEIEKVAKKMDMPEIDVYNYMKIFVDSYEKMAGIKVVTAGDVAAELLKGLKQ